MSDNLVDQSLFRRPPAAEGRHTDNLFRMVIQQFEPFFGGIVRRQHLTFAIFLMHRIEQILRADPVAGRRPGLCHRPLDRLLLRPLDDRGENRAADEIAAIQHLVLTIPKANG